MFRDPEARAGPGRSSVRRRQRFVSPALLC